MVYPFISSFVCSLMCNFIYIFLVIHVDATMLQYASTSVLPFTPSPSVSLVFARTKRFTVVHSPKLPLPLPLPLRRILTATTKTMRAIPACLSVQQEKTAQKY